MTERPEAKDERAIRVVQRDGVLVEGEDSTSWLQGQLSQDIESLSEDESALSLVLSPQGKVDSFVRVSALSGGRYLLDVEEGFGEALTERLARFKLRVKVTLLQVRVACEERAGLGFSSFGPPQLVDEASPPRVSPGDDEAFEAFRIIAGVPRLGRELTGKTIPQEAGPGLVERTVSFTKGCYTGQELVARLDSRGSNVPRRARLVRGRADGAGETLPLPGGAVLVEGEEMGVLTSVAPLGDSFVAIGLIKRAVYDEVVEALVEGGDGAQLPATITSFEQATEGN